MLPSATQYCHLTARLQGDVLLVAIREGVFDAIPELNGPNPTERGVVEEFTDALSSSPAGVVLDIRSAGEINKRTLSLVLLLAGALSRSGLRRAICCTPGAAEVLQVSRMTGVCPCYTDLLQALSSLGVGGE